MFKTQKQQSTAIILSGVVAFGLLIILMNAFSPDQFVPIGTLLIFGLIYVVCYALLFVVYSLISGLFGMFAVKPNRRNLNYRIYLYLAIFSMVPVVVLAIQSIRDTGVIEIGLILLFACLICFYISRR